MLTHSSLFLSGFGSITMNDAITDFGANCESVICAISILKTGLMIGFCQLPAQFFRSVYILQKGVCIDTLAGKQSKHLKEAPIRTGGCSRITFFFFLSAHVILYMSFCEKNVEAPFILVNQIISAIISFYHVFCNWSGFKKIPVQTVKLKLIVCFM